MSSRNSTPDFGATSMPMAAPAPNPAKNVHFIIPAPITSELSQHVAWSREMNNRFAEAEIQWGQQLSRELLRVEIIEIDMSRIEISSFINAPQERVFDLARSIDLHVSGFE